MLLGLIHLSLKHSQDRNQFLRNATVDIRAEIIAYFSFMKEYSTGFIRHNDVFHW